VIELHDERVYLLYKYDMTEFGENYSKVLGVFANTDAAQQYMFSYIREEYDIEDDIADEDLQKEMGVIEFEISQYWVIE
jgi:hypothetical protein